MRAERGFTLLEIVIGLVVTSIVMLIVTDLLGAQAQQSVAPVTQARATVLAQGLQREILSKAFDENSSGHNDGERCSDTISCTTSANLGPDNGETRSTFDDVDDYHGYSVIRNSAGQAITQSGQSLYQGYQLNVVVFYDDNLDGIDDAAGVGSYTGNAKLIRVSVLTPNDETIVFSGYRWNY
ncbi:prepilin-type N-terminal cleavage/methylation domain-containing protein [Alteromonas lipotrueae]|uniref:prepilin-type N-terminal cleavage/methylation domain-containing protein n=1 Tax=Alteromonas lipotrueae TaxID=2803814 RepID=UPI001C44E242|nr:prepilin-type N-terminal cleavage/methylation domain-containing protein [Alteromonas lipotrueae]